MIDLYTANTFNGQRAAIMLEETGLEYTAHKVDLLKGEQHHADFLKLNSSARIPVIVDHNSGNNEPFILTQSITILQYLAEKSHQLLPIAVLERAKVYEWMNFHGIDIGSTLFNAYYLQNRVKPAQQQAAEQLRERVVGLYQYFDDQLKEQEFFAGEYYSIADIAAFPAVLVQEEALTNYKNLNRWLEQLKLRPAIQRGMAV